MAQTRERYFFQALRRALYPKAINIPHDTCIYNSHDVHVNKSGEEDKRGSSDDEIADCI